MLIVDMPMPKNCEQCPLTQRVYSDCENFKLYCLVERKEIIMLGIPVWCPIKGVLSETHGRLIDEAVFCENVVKYSHQSTKTIGKALDATPTIIEMTPIVTERKDDEQIH